MSEPKGPQRETTPLPTCGWCQREAREPRPFHTGDLCARHAHMEARVVALGWTAKDWTTPCD